MPGNDAISVRVWRLRSLRASRSVSSHCERKSAWLALAFAAFAAFGGANSRRSRGGPASVHRIARQSVDAGDACRHLPQCRVDRQRLPQAVTGQALLASCRCRSSRQRWDRQRPQCRLLYRHLSATSGNRSDGFAFVVAWSRHGPPLPASGRRGGGPPRHPASGRSAGGSLPAAPRSCASDAG